MKKHGFTLVELLVAAVILFFIATLVMSGSYGAMARVRQAACMDNLKTVCAASIMYMKDFGAIYSHPDAGSHAGTWAHLLTANRYMDELAPSMACPSLQSFLQIQTWGNGSGVGWKRATYAINLTEPHFMTTARFPGGWESDIHVLVEDRIEIPADYWFYVDSVRYYREGRQQFAVLRGEDVRGEAGDRGVHFRHNGTANIAFMDGRVEQVSPELIKVVSPVSVDQGFDQDDNKITF